MRTLPSVLLLFLYIGVALPLAARAEVVIGAFSNGGTSCSFSGNTTGLVTAHVVVRSDAGGFRGVRFAAPIPDCFDAVFVQETVPDGMFYIGNSQTGISIAMPDCTDLPTRVLDITYYTAGGTTPCCEFPLVADPLAGYLQAVDCSQNEIPMQSLTSYLNADSTCVCSYYQAPPYPPANPYPAHGAAWVEQNLTLRWSCSDPGNLEVLSDLYFGTTPEPPLLVAGIPGYTNFSYQPPRLSPETTYYWKIVARNLGGAETSGPVWQFSTGPNSIPFVTLLTPVNGSTLQPLATTLKWSGVDDTALTYDVYFGTDPWTLARVVTATTATQYSPPSLAWQTTYYWRVTARDLDGGVGMSDTWSFTTRAQDLPPNVPSSPSPASSATNVSLMPTLTWQCTDPDGQSLRYDVYFGTLASQPLVASNRTTRSYAPGVLLPATVYAWRIVARDPSGQTTSGPVWTFTTGANHAPNAPASPVPANGSTGRPTTQVLSWSCTDPDGQALVYDVYFGAESAPPLVASNLASASYSPPPQSFATKYSWRIVARDPFGAQANGPTWSYTTKNENEPPGVPSSPNPANSANNQPLTVTLTWSATDPEGQALNFDVYFGTDVSPPLVADHVTTKSYTVGPLAISTAYRWRIVARDTGGLETSGPTWYFYTAATTSLPPGAPSNPSPANGSIVADTTPFLSWQCSDPEGDPLQYTIYMSTYDTFPDQIWNTNTPYFQVPQPLPYGPISWFVVASDGHWTTGSAWWTFTVTSVPVAVAFRSFTAEQNGLSVDVNWDLASDEAMESYTVYRRVKDGEPVALASGRVQRTTDSYRDATVEAGRAYSYELVVRSSGGEEFRSPVATVTMEKVELTLHQNVPNPFNPQTAIRYDVPAAGRVRLMVFDVNGRLVRSLVDEERPAGSYEAVWTGRDDAGQPVSSGVYFYVLEAGKQRLTKKLVLLK